MKKILCVFLFCTPLWVVTYSQFSPGCSKYAPKVSFSGKAPWAIDGSIKDWMTILGPYTGGDTTSYYGSFYGDPFSPPRISAFNFSNDVVPGGQRVLESPRPESDIRWMSFTHDDYNVYFYLRRKLNGSSSNTFYYFFDVNGDAVMNAGEPVVHATFTNDSISALTLGLYAPNKDTLYSKQKMGSWMGGGFPPYSTELDRDRYPQEVNGYPMQGDVLDLFTSQMLFSPPYKLGKNEIFKAALTENGYGVELAIPWRYLKNWSTLNSPLNPGDIFFYKVSMQEGQGEYNPKRVVDNAGSCQGGPGISGNPALSKSLTTTTLVPGSAYRFKLEYTNLTQVATEVGLEYVDLDFTPDPGLPVTSQDFIMTVFADNNCNSTLDAGEKAATYRVVSSYFRFSILPTGELQETVEVLPPFGKGCFIVDLTLPPNGAVTKFKISFNTSIFFAVGKEPCDPGCGSKPINRVGFLETEIGGSQLATEAQKAQQGRTQQEMQTDADVVLYPNPGKGATNLALPQSADITVVDNVGKAIQTINKAKAGIIQLNNLRPGIYIVKARFVETGKVVIKKLIVLP